MGVYQSTQQGTLDTRGDKLFSEGSSVVEHDLSSRENKNGFRLGWDINSDHTPQAKTRYELTYEQRAFEYELNGQKKEGDAWRLGTSMSLGYNLDWLLTDEIVPFFRVGAGLGTFHGVGNGTDLALGVGIVYATRRFEILAGVDREFWLLEGTKFPFNNLFDNEAIIHNVHLGVNVRF